MENLPQEQRKQRLIQSKPSEKGEIITYLSRMGDVLEQVTDRRQFVFTFGGVNIVRNCNKADIVLGEKFLCQSPDFNIVSSETG